MKNFIRKNNKGFSTLFIVIVLGGVALSLTLALSTSSFLSIVSGRDSNISNKTRALINACAEIALEVMRENNAYTGTNSVTLNSNVCTYTVSNTGGMTRSIVVSGTISDITRKLQINTNTFNPLTISSWQEVP